MASSSAFFSIWARSLSASGNFSLSIACRWLAIFLLSAWVCLASALVSTLASGLGLDRSPAPRRERRAGAPASAAGIRTTQARRGSRRPNSAATSRSATFLLASAIRAGPPGSRAGRRAGSGPS